MSRRERLMGTDLFTTAAEAIGFRRECDKRDGWLLFRPMLKWLAGFGMVEIHYFDTFECHVEIDGEYHMEAGGKSLPAALARLVVDVAAAEREGEA